MLAVASGRKVDKERGRFPSDMAIFKQGLPCTRRQAAGIGRPAAGNQQAMPAMTETAGLLENGEKQLFMEELPLASWETDDVY